MSTSASNPHGSPKAKTQPHVNSSMPMISPSRPILKGKSNCPVQFGRKPGLRRTLPQALSSPTWTAKGNPTIPAMSYPSLPRCRRLLHASRHTQRLRVHSVAGDLGINDKVHASGAPRPRYSARAVGIPKTIEPAQGRSPALRRCATMLNEAGLNRQRTPSSSPLGLCVWL